MVRPVRRQRQRHQRCAERDRSRRREHANRRVPPDPRERDDPARRRRPATARPEAAIARDAEEVEDDLDVLAVPVRRALGLEQRARVVDVVRERLDVCAQLAADARTTADSPRRAASPAAASPTARRRVRSGTPSNAKARSGAPTTAARLSLKSIATPTSAPAPMNLPRSQSQPASGAIASAAIIVSPAWYQPAVSASG